MIAVLGWGAYVAYRDRRRAEGVAQRWRQGREEVAAYLRLMADAQPVKPTDRFATCPNPECDMDDYHLITNIDGTKATRCCVHCQHEWTIDHATKETAMGKNKNDEEPPAPKGNCPNGGDHTWVREGHDMVCSKGCGARYTVD